MAISGEIVFFCFSSQKSYANLFMSSASTWKWLWMRACVCRSHHMWTAVNGETFMDSRTFWRWKLIMCEFPIASHHVCGCLHQALRSANRILMSDGVDDELAFMTRIRNTYTHTHPTESRLLILTSSCMLLMLRKSLFTLSLCLYVWTM